MLVKQANLMRRFVSNAAAHSMIGIDIGQVHTKMVWLKMLPHRPAEFSSIKIPTFPPASELTRAAPETAVTKEVPTEGESVTHSDESSPASPDERRETTSNPFKRRRVVKSSTSQGQWNATSLKALCRRIRTTLCEHDSLRCGINVNLSMAVCDVRGVYLPKETSLDQRSIAAALQQSIGSEEARSMALLPIEETKQKLRVFSVPEGIAWSVAHAFDAASMRLEKIDALPWCLARALSEECASNSSGPVGVVLDWSHGRPTLVAIDNGEIKYVRRFVNGGISTLLSQVKEELDVDDLEAARWLSHCMSNTGISGDVVSDTRQWAQLCCSQLAQEINVAIDYLRWQHQGNSIDKLHLVGGGAAMPQLVQYLDQETSIDVEPVQLKNSASSLSPEYATAATLAMQGVFGAK